MTAVYHSRAISQTPLGAGSRVLLDFNVGTCTENVLLKSRRFMTIAAERTWIEVSLRRTRRAADSCLERSGLGREGVGGEGGGWGGGEKENVRDFTMDVITMRFVESSEGGFNVFNCVGGGRPWTGGTAKFRPRGSRDLHPQ